MPDATTANLPAPLNTVPFLQGREIILAVLTLGKGFFCEETDTLGTTYRTAHDWLKVHDGEHVEKLIRFDLEALHGEDVTETVADAFLDGLDAAPAQQHRLPGFVPRSEAFDRWRADPGSAPCSQAAHGTLNHRQQFGA
ncbi:hypothetical protein [Ensifer sp.]|jgi:hypothetical protein|uniref:hypothetical protein n=1 Tax=Ensifer sp. TaxID=1872086 RepID=UPI002E12364D|nr:hypothetical protein [Ensifer sp.]